MKPKVYCICLLLLCCYSHSFAQFILAGKHGSNDFFQDLIPDSTVYSVDPNGMPYYNFQSNTNTLLIDINGDQVNDFKIATIYSNGNQWYQQFYSTITPLNNNSVAVSHFDSCFTYLTPPVFQYVTAMAKSFFITDSIDRYAHWIDSTAYFAYHNENANFSNCFTNAFAQSEGYAGVKVLLPDDTLFGWIKVQAVKYDSVSVQEFACNYFSTGIETSLNETSLTIYPNPTSGKFLLIDDEFKFESYDLEIYNILGEKISTRKINTGKTEIDLTGNPKGLYFLKRVIENESGMKKLIIN